MEYSIPSKGVKFLCNLSHDDAADLAEKLDSNFARDLAHRWKSSHNCSQLQLAWLHYLVRPPEVSSIKLPNIVELMLKAVMKGIAHPIIRGVNCKIGRRRRGGLYVVDTRDDRVVADIAVDGSLSPRPSNEIVGELMVMNADVLAFATLYGHRTGKCCFCGRHLETTESVTVGYGPICAERYGLPWGEVVEV